eukprot:m.23860 g.23860  ORF g.23860 m.23860 type:complete len:70 (-) comp8536_c0_seq2:161-370(-)
MLTVKAWLRTPFKDKVDVVNEKMENEAFGTWKFFRDLQDLFRQLSFRAPFVCGDVDVCVCAPSRPFRFS